MARRFLPAIYDAQGRQGAYGSEWEGWVNPRDRSVGAALRMHPSHPARIVDLENRVGCYAILYRPGSGRMYVMYVGFSKSLATELESRHNGWRIWEVSFPFAAAYIPNAAVARAYELDLIQYYTPPWNTRYA